MQIESRVEEIPFRQALSIAGRTLSGQSVLSVTIRHGQWVAQAEAAGVFYRGDTGLSMQRELLAQQAQLAQMPDEPLAAWHHVQAMAPGGARNALDWALWQLVAAERGQPSYRLAFLSCVQPLPTMVTLGLADPASMAEAALSHAGARALKLKLGGSDEDADRIEVVRRARPDVRLSVDANEGWTMDHLDRMMGVLQRERVELVEQPLPAQQDSALAQCRFPIPLAADESLQTLDDLDTVAQRYQVANIKLDKCGGLSAALTLVNEARRRGLRVMIGCMGGRSRAILPAFIAAQTADLVDLDAPLFMASDTQPEAHYVAGRVSFEASAFSLTDKVALSLVNASL